MAVFDRKFYNDMAWGAYKDYLVREKPSKLLLSGSVVGNSEVRTALSNQTGSGAVTLPFYSDGTESTTTQPYDGVTDIVPDPVTTYMQTFGTMGKAKAWTETDFSIDLTTAEGVNAVYRRLSNWQRYVVEQPLVLNIIKGLFAANAGQTQKTDFIDNHSTAVTAMTPVALNNALEKATGDYKDQLTLFICHSQIATQLENLQMLDYVKYTTPSGIATDTTLRMWNGRIVMVDNTVNAGVAAGSYVGFALGLGMITLQNLGVRVPIETARDPYKKGGQDALITRERYAFGAKGFSFEPAAPKTNYVDADLTNGANWKLVNDGNGNFMPHKEIPLAKITYTPTP